MQFRANKKRSAPSVIIVSLIDVLMVVLIFLVVSTTFKERVPALDLNLPASQHAGSAIIPTWLQCVARGLRTIHHSSCPTSVPRPLVAPPRRKLRRNADGAGVPRVVGVHRRTNVLTQNSGTRLPY